MLEKMFTTKMSADKKKLQTRFLKIRSKNSKMSKVIALCAFVLIIVSVILVSVMVAVRKQNERISYQNEEMNIRFEIPAEWSDKYIVDESMDGQIVVKHKRISEKHNGMGTLFTVMKVRDDEIDELMNMVGNMTVLWRNAEYGYLFCRPTDVQAPIFADSDAEDFNLADEYDRMYEDVSYIESTFSLISEKTLSLIPTAENLSYAEMREIQRQVDNGHFSWRLDYEQVVQSFLSGKGIDVAGGEITALAGGLSEISLTYSVGGEEYHFDLFRPIKKTEDGIWVVRTFQNKRDGILKEVFFYERSPAGTLIEVGNDGRYALSEYTMASFGWFEVGDEYYPVSVSAYFTPAGWTQRREIARIEAPFTYRTMAQVLSIDLDLSKLYQQGDLYFVFRFADGSSEEVGAYPIFVDRTNSAVKQFSLSKINPETNRLEGESFQQADGWYKVYPKTMMTVLAELALEEVVAYYTPYDAETARIEVGRTTEFVQAPFSMELNFPQRFPKGYLVFEMTHEHGTEVSPTYFVYME